MSGKQPHRPLPRPQPLDSPAAPANPAPVIGEPLFPPAKKPAVRSTPTAAPKPALSGVLVTQNESVTSRAKRKQSLLSSPLVIVVGGVVLLALVGGGAAATYFLAAGEEPLALRAIGIQTTGEGETLALRVEVESPPQTADARQKAVFRLDEAPQGAALDADGNFTWTPDESQGPGQHRIVVSARLGEQNATMEFLVYVEERNEPPVFDASPSQTVESGGELSLAVAARDPDIPAAELVYEIKSGPPEARIDPLTGAITWRVSGPARRVSFVVAAREKKTGGLSATTSIDVDVQPPPRDAVAELTNRMRVAGIVTTRVGSQSRPGVAAPAQVYRVGSEMLDLYAFASADAARQAMTQLSTAGGDAKRARRGYQVGDVVVVYEGDAKQLVAQLDAALGAPAFERAVQVASNDPLPMPVVPVKPAGPTEDDLTKREDDQIFALYEDKLLFKPEKSYEALRAIYSARFERAHRAEIDAAFDAELKQWLDDHPNVKEELFTAFVPEDNLPAGLALFATLWRNHPDDIEEYWNAAVAVAVTWDGNRGAIETYGHHQSRCKAILPDTLVGAEENFTYLVGKDSGKYLPWEFLVYVVNHQTPLEERQWAVANYFPKRLTIGESFGDVPYDKVMLETGSSVCRLDGKAYTLPNIRQFGGVCAMQADFASRVGKSLGIPAAYVRGESNGGDLHAWVEWVALKQVGPQRIVFSLESHGRYAYDKYYVGELEQPQTGLETTDRAMELELQTVGLDPRAHRHSQRVLASWPAIRDRTSASVRDEYSFMADVTRLCPGNTDAWKEIAGITRRVEFDAKSRKLPSQALEDLFRTFSAFPDFTWTVFDDLIAYEPDLKKRIGLYERLLVLYVGAKRPDLASQARLKLTDMLIESGQRDAAGNGLVVTLLAFADDGRYVRPMLDKLEMICRDIETGPEIMDRFWTSFLPRVPQMRGDTPTPHAIDMHKRAIAWFTSRGNAAAVQALQVELAKIQAGQGRRS